MRVVAGLGNPGMEYAGSRHNLGFEVVERIAARWRAPFGPPRGGLRVARARFEAEVVWLVEPLMFMNRSGEALVCLDVDGPLCSGILVVVHDDVDLACGRVAVKQGGGTAGHRGVASVVAQLGPDFVRVRVGIGSPADCSDMTDYVLDSFEPEERELIEPAVERAADAVESILRDGVEHAMNLFNRRPDTP